MSIGWYFLWKCNTTLFKFGLCRSISWMWTSAQSKTTIFRKATVAVHFFDLRLWRAQNVPTCSKNILEIFLIHELRKVDFRTILHERQRFGDEVLDIAHFKRDAPYGTGSFRAHSARPTGHPRRFRERILAEGTQNRTRALKAIRSLEVTKIIHNSVLHFRTKNMKK